MFGRKSKKAKRGCGNCKNVEASTESTKSCAKNCSSKASGKVKDKK